MLHHVDRLLTSSLGGRLLALPFLCRATIAFDAFPGVMLLSLALERCRALTLGLFALYPLRTFAFLFRGHDDRLTLRPYALPARLIDVGGVQGLVAGEQVTAETAVPLMGEHSLLLLLDAALLIKSSLLLVKVPLSLELLLALQFGIDAVEDSIENLSAALRGDRRRDGNGNDERIENTAHAAAPRISFDRA